MPADVECADAEMSVLFQLLTVWSPMVSQPTAALHSRRPATKSESENCWHLVAAKHFQSGSVRRRHQESVGHTAGLDQQMSLADQGVY